MRRILIFTLFCLPILTMAQTTITYEKDVIEQKTNGFIDWSKQYIEAKGESVIDTARFKNQAQARAMATRGAVVVAQRNLLEIINGVQVNSETTVEDMVAINDKIITKVDGVIKGAEIVNGPAENWGMIEVTMRVYLYENNGLASAIYDDVPRTKEETAVAEQVKEKNQSIKEDKENLKEEKKENNLKNNPNTLPSKGEENPAEFREDKASDLKDIVFNLAGKEFDPALFPIIEDKEGNVLVDFYKLYDPNKGGLPKILNTTSDLLKEAGVKKGVEIIDVIEAFDGKIVVDTLAKKKFNWNKLGDTLGKIGKLVLMLV